MGLELSYKNIIWDKLFEQFCDEGECLADRGGYEGRFKTEDDYGTKNDKSNKYTYLKMGIS